jgi:hypothetical protein
VKGGLVAAGVAVLALGAALAWAVRRQPSRVPLEDEPSAFTVQASGPGQLITFQDTRAPLRAFRWLPPLPGGVLVAQVLGQNDRQRVAWFRDGAFQGLLLVLKPVGVPDGFWRFAALAGAALAPDGSLVLGYRSEDPAGTDPPLVLDLDPASQQVRWSYRGRFERMALGPEPSLYLYSTQGPILRLPLPPPAPSGPAGVAPETVDLPGEVTAVDALLPTGPNRFLVAHPGGLAAYRSGAGWTPYPLPGDPGIPCKDWKAGLAQAGGGFWWQPAPGTLVRVRADGRPVSPWRGQLPDTDPFARDARLLRLLGAAPDGSLWFDLATPVIPPADAAAAPGTAPTAGPDSAPAGAEPGPPGPGGAPGDDWAAYLAQGLDRIYRWRPGAKGLERMDLAKAWPALDPPAALPPPVPGQDLVPAAGGLVGESGRTAWWLPLAALPFTPAGQLR